MAIASWLSQDRTLSPLALTVRAQTFNPLDLPDRLGYPLFFPNADVPGVEISDIMAVDYRPVSERREWDAPGREIPLRTPILRPVKMVPVEAKNTIGEEELNRLKMSSGGNDDIYRRLLGADIPSRVDLLVEANFRRLEVDALTNAWAAGNLVQRMPEDPSKTYTVSFGFDTNRYPTAGTAWDNTGVNAYDLFVADIFAAQGYIGPVSGAMMRLNVYNAILADAPDLPNGVLMTRTSLQDRLSQDIGKPFQMVVNEQTQHVFASGGSDTTTTNVWPAGKVGYIPADGTIGRMARAPVVRNMDLVAAVGPRRVDVRGQSVFYVDVNDGKGLRIECQTNQMPIPDEQKVYVRATGVA